MSKIYCCASFGLFNTWLLFIVCTSCMAGQLISQGIFRRVTSGSILKTNVISGHNTVSMMNCGQLCLIHRVTCVAFNYKSAGNNDKNNCQLTNSTKNKHKENSASDWTFYKVWDTPSHCCLKNPCKNGGECIVNYKNPNDFTCKCGVRYRGKVCKVQRVYKSCKTVLEIYSGAEDGIYRIKTNTTSGYTDVYCQMAPLLGCSGGGWTMVMKIDGAQNNFNYSSKYWSNGESYNPSGGLTAFDDKETKLATYNSTSFKELCVGMKVDNNLNFVSINYIASSLYTVIADERFHKTKLGRKNWKSLIANSSLQRKCGKEGFNIVPLCPTCVYVRLGIVGNQGGDGCNSPDSFIGFGGQVYTHTSCVFQPSPVACGNVASCNSDYGKAEIKAMGYILVR